MMVQVQAFVVGAGSRGFTYAAHASEKPQDLKIVGIAEPRNFQRDKFASQHKIEDKQYVFSDWREALAKEKFADCVFICTPDRLHKEIAVAFANAGYHILLEKPMATNYEDCQEIVKTCRANKVFLTVCHVLRYSPQSRKISEIIQSGVIGDVVNIQLLEPIGFWHYAHSYVRGNWRNKATSAFSLLTKSCHDLDLIVGWMRGHKCSKVSSFGSLKHFTKENKPAGAGSRCFDCSVEAACPYSAKKLYLNCVKQGITGFPVGVIADVPDIESVTEALRSGPYGRCVYNSDNDVCDHQVVNLQYENGATASFTMVAFTEKICARQARVFGTKGELSCDFDSPFVRHYDFLKQAAVTHDLRKEHQQSSSSRLAGHFGADYFTITSFIKAVAENDEGQILTGPEESLMSHYLCFMAEKARLEDKVITL